METPLHICLTTVGDVEEEEESLVLNIIRAASLQHSLLGFVDSHVQ
jgi:hypothetical protein